MKNFKTKYNYLIPLGRIFFGLFFLSLAIVGVTMIPKSLLSNEFSFGMLILLPLFTLFLFFQAYRFLRFAFEQSSNYTFEKSQISSKNVLFGKKSIIQNDDICGFSTSTYPLRIWQFKVITIYLKNGDKIELPQFLYFNYKQIENTLISNSIKSYGHEIYGQNFFTLSRNYTFE